MLTYANSGHDLRLIGVIGRFGSVRLACGLSALLEVMSRLNRTADLRPEERYRSEQVVGCPARFRGYDHPFGQPNSFFRRMRDHRQSKKIRADLLVL
jgi:hypothetical protein